MGDRGVLRIVDDPAAAAAALLRATATADSSRRAEIVLAGGSTPEQAYGLAADADWSGARCWLGDERCVARDDERSNAAMIERSLISATPHGPPVFEAIDGTLGPHAAAADYDTRLRSALGAAPVFDLVLLGLGPDAHTASLFPGKPEIDIESDALAVGVPDAGLQPFVPRVTLTLRALAGGEQVVFLVTGEGKAEAVARSFVAGSTTPAGRVFGAAGDRALVLLDAGAASDLPRDQIET